MRCPLGVKQFAWCLGIGIIVSKVILTPKETDFDSLVWRLISHLEPSFKSGDMITQRRTKVKPGYVAGFLWEIRY
jgi:hypothetical protein